MQQEQAPFDLLFLRLDLRRHVFRLEFFRPRLVAPLLGGEIAEQLPDRYIRGVARGHLVKALALRFHQLRVGTNLVEPERPQQPDRLAFEKPFDVLSPDQRDMIAKLLAVQLKQPVTMAVFFFGHGREHPSRPQIRFAHRLGEVAIGAIILLFQGDREGQQLLLAQIGEVLHCPFPRCAQ